MENINFDKLLGQKATLYPCNNLNMFQLGSVIFEVVEDENDGYRSTMKDVRIVSNTALTANVLDEVIIGKSDELYTITSVEDGHKWLEFGTDYADYYYPCFVFSFTPKTPPDELINMIKR